MKTLTKDEIRDVMEKCDVSSLAKDAEKYKLVSYDWAQKFANAILAKYAQPSEREIIERERKAWDSAVERWHQTHSICGYSESVASMKEERDRRYPLPKQVPPPVLTDEEINAAWRDERTLPLSYFDASRKIERAVLTKLAEQKP